MQFLLPVNGRWISIVVLTFPPAGHHLCSEARLSHRICVRAVLIRLEPVKTDDILFKDVE
jgi:hypothetical protein